MVVELTYSQSSFHHKSFGRSHIIVAVILMKLLVMQSASLNVCLKKAATMTRMVIKPVKTLPGPLIKFEI